MNTDIVLSGIVLVLFVAVFVMSRAPRKARAVEQEPDVGADIFEPALAEDINAPSLATIDEALRHVDRDSNPDAVDWLLERRLIAMRKVEASWPSI